MLWICCRSVHTVLPNIAWFQTKKVERIRIPIWYGTYVRTGTKRSFRRIVKVLQCTVRYGTVRHNTFLWIPYRTKRKKKMNKNKKWKCKISFENNLMSSLHVTYVVTNERTYVGRYDETILLFYYSNIRLHRTGTLVPVYTF